MTEGFGDPSPNRRGRRNPALREQLDTTLLDNEEELLTATGEEGEIPAGPAMLYPGGVITYRTSMSVKIDGLESWHTYGAMDRVQEDETEDDAFARIVTVVNTRVVDSIFDAIERREELLEHLRQDRERAANARIRPRQ